MPSAPKTLILAAPSWERHNSLIGNGLPFPLWPIVDQPLLYHWLDYAISKGYSSIEIYTPTHLSIFQKFLKKATLWPIQSEVLSIEKLKDTSPFSALDRLPWADPQLPVPGDPWSLVHYWQALEHQAFEYSYLHQNVSNCNLAIGRYCIIHPTAKINMPVWIGNSVSIGPDSEIGPYVSIGDEAIIEGSSKITYSRVEKNTFLGSHTELDRSYVNGHALYNLKNKAHIPYLDPFLADFVTEPSPSPSLLERFLALTLWSFFKVMDLMLGNKQDIDGSSKTTHHFRLPKISKKAHLWQQRYPWLLSVVSGKLFIFGVLPRTPSQFQRLPKDTQEILVNQPIGVFSYADTQNCHSPEDSREASHAIYQATQPKKKILPLCRQYLLKLIINTIRYGH